MKGSSGPHVAAPLTRTKGRTCGKQLSPEQHTQFSVVITHENHLEQQRTRDREVHPATQPGHR